MANPHPKPRTKYIRPSKEAVRTLMTEHKSVREAAKAYGCSRATIQRWAYQYNLSNRGKGALGYPKGTMQPGSLPTAVLGPIIRDIVDKYETGALGDGVLQKGKAAFEGGKVSLMFPDNMPKQYRVPARTITAIMGQERLGVRFDTADKILCWLDSNHLWHVPPLNEWYWEGYEKPEGLDAIVEGLVQMHSKAQAA